jgi:hypothetical protein
MFSSLEKSFDLLVYADAMACASLPTRPSYVPCKHNVDPKVVEYFDIDATVDASFFVDCSDSKSSSLSGADIDATVDASFPVDCSNSESSSLSGTIFQWRFSKSRPCSDIVCHNLLSCLLMYFLRDWCHSYFHSDLQ